MNNVNFGSLARVPGTLKVKNSTSRQLAQTINGAFKEASKELGQHIRPFREISSKSLKYINPDSFNKASGRITEQGVEGFDILNRNLGVDSSSTVVDYGKALKKYLVETFRINGSVDRYFDYFTK